MRRGPVLIVAGLLGVTVWLLIPNLRMIHLNGYALSVSDANSLCGSAFGTLARTASGRVAADCAEVGFATAASTAAGLAGLALLAAGIWKAVRR